MDLTFSPQDNPETTVLEALRHRNNLKAAEVNCSVYFKDNKFNYSTPFDDINPSITDPATELTEDDIFRMKTLKPSKAFSEIGDQFSAVSVADSTSNFDDNTAENEMIYDELENEDNDDNRNNSQEDGNNIDLNESETVTCGDFVFGRKRIENPKLNCSTVSVLNYPFVPVFVPQGENVKEYEEYFTKAKVYLVGTAHFSHESQRDVLNTILAVQPDIVMVELCFSRISILSMDEQTLLREAKSLDCHSMLAIIRQSGFLQGILHVLLLSTSAHITRQLGMAPGGEFRAAQNGSRRVKHCRVVLGDRPIQITLQRALNSLSFFQKIRLFFRIIVSNCTVVTQEDVERCKDKYLLEELLKEMAGEFPQLTEIFVNERDQYMSQILHNLVHQTTVEKCAIASSNGVLYEPVNVVAVVGIGHVAGILENWNTRIDTTQLLTLPKPSKTSKFVMYSLKVVFYGLTIYGVYRVGKYSFNKISSLAVNKLLS